MYESLGAIGPTTLTKFAAWHSLCQGVCHGGQIILSASSFYLIDGLLTLLGTPQAGRANEKKTWSHLCPAVLAEFWEMWNDKPLRPLLFISVTSVYPSRMYVNRIFRFIFAQISIPPKKTPPSAFKKKTSLVFKKASGKPWRVVVFSTSPRGFMGVYMFHHHQVVDLGEHILEGHGLTEDASRTGCAGRAKVQLIQLVPDLLAHAWSCTLVEWHDNFFFSTIKMEKKTTSNRKHTKNTKNCWLTLYSSFLLVGSFDNVGRTRKIILAI